MKKIYFPLVLALLLAFSSDRFSQINSFRGTNLNLKQLSMTGAEVDLSNVYTNARIYEFTPSISTGTYSGQLKAEVISGSDKVGIEEGSLSNVNTENKTVTFSAGATLTIGIAENAPKGTNAVIKISAVDKPSIFASFTISYSPSE